MAEAFSVRVPLGSQLGSQRGCWPALQSRDAGFRGGPHVALNVLLGAQNAGSRTVVGARCRSGSWVIYMVRCSVVASQPFVPLAYLSDVEEEGQRGGSHVGVVVGGKNKDPDPVDEIDPDLRGDAHALEAIVEL